MVTIMGICSFIIMFLTNGHDDDHDGGVVDVHDCFADHDGDEHEHGHASSDEHDDGDSGDEDHGDDDGDTEDTRKKVYSRAFHQAKTRAYRNGKPDAEAKEEARAAGKKAVEDWETELE